MQDWAMDPEKDKEAKEKEEEEKDEKVEKDDPETLRKARDWDEYRDGKISILTLAMLNKLRCHIHFQFSANQITVFTLNVMTP